MEDLAKGGLFMVPRGFIPDCLTVARVTNNEWNKLLRPR